MTDRLRIVYDNLADTATNTMSSEAGSLVVANLLTDTKTEVARSIGTSLTITSQWSSSKIVGCVALAFCNLTATATIRVRGYTEIADVVAAVDTGTVLACAYAPFGLWEWGHIPLGTNTYSNTGNAYGIAWFDRSIVKRVVIDIVDVDSVDGYIEASRLIIGTYWEPQRNADYGLSLTYEDNSKQHRTDAGDLRVDVGCRYSKIAINLDAMTPTDRANLFRIFRYNGLSKPVFFSVFPNSNDPEREQAHSIYGKLSSMTAIIAASYERYTATIEIEEN